jgi:hypothetical protein
MNGYSASVVFTYNGNIFSVKRGRNSDRWYNMDKP